MNDINLVDLFEPKQGHLDYVGSAAIVVKHAPLTVKEHEITAVIRSRPGITLIELRRIFKMDAQFLDDCLTRIERKGILFGENEGTIMITDENGVYKE